MTDPIRKDAIQFSQTERKGWVLTMTPQELIQLLPPRGPQQMSLFTEVNRPITSRHKDAIEGFIENTPDWALPNITLAATPEALKETRNQISLHPEHLKILDGQHRLEALANLSHQWAVNSNQEGLDHLNTQQIPITIFEVRDNREQRQLFAWFARSRPIEASVRDFFDDTDPYNRAAKAAMELSGTLKERVDWRNRRAPANSPNIMSLANLKEIAVTITMGVSRSPKAQDRAVVNRPEVQQKLQDQIVEFFDTFLPSCPQHYGFLKESQNLNGDILKSKQSSYAVDPMVIRLFANAWARWRDYPDPQPTDRLAENINALNLNMASPENDIQTTFGLTNEKRRLHSLQT